MQLIKPYKTLNVLLKGAIGVLLLLVIWKQVFAREDLPDLLNSFYGQWSISRLPWLLLIFLLLPLNWGLESYKWHLLVHPFTDIRFADSVRSIMCGVTLSLITPNRIGDYGGRILKIEAKDNLRAVAATAVGNFSQLVVLLALGILGALYFSGHYVLSNEGYTRNFLWAGGLLLLALLWGFFHIGKVTRLLRKLPLKGRIKRWIEQISIIEMYDWRDLMTALLLSFLRYLVYTMQYVFILKFFGIEVPFLAALSGIATIFFIQSSIPLPPLIGLLARGEIALFIWGYFSANDISILAATFSLFIINLVLPALVGTAYIARVNLLKSFGYEEKPN